jgi:hypothetical protein
MLSWKALDANTGRCHDAESVMNNNIEWNNFLTSSKE